ncbi:malonate decarboxylase holo-ACP synthase [Acerihabitans sp. TG2]|uniref:malonate decarboxylase holo-ACP synthase n=1 Tax=Acerihabitans sp. TG2 TaxID=3096008 RepID=UPI002B23991A|nr:malonate decarboxylase holo-ACP synthase [Acerihabitans sp. TG2]MEA9390915.1 malonate decarboxylase holo-ACP synthase [Acerihabitans sp. TG2]
MHPIRPHDLLWIDRAQQLDWHLPAPEWVASQWSSALPLVVRRDHGLSGQIAVGVRGAQRGQRAAAWVPATAIVRTVSPEALIATLPSMASRDDAIARHGSLTVLSALAALARIQWPWIWGVTGSCGYMLATGVNVCTPSSDLDLLIRCPVAQTRENFAPLLATIATLPCRVDIQVETPLGGWALLEWLRGGKVLIKTDRGPVICRDPWTFPMEQRTS